MKKENKRCSLKQTIYSGRPCKENEVWGEGSCGWGGRRERGTRNWSVHLQVCAAFSVLWSERDILRYPERDIHGAAAVQEDAVGDQPRFLLQPPCLMLHAPPAVARPQQHLRGDKALLYLTQPMCCARLQLITPQLPWIKDEYWIISRAGAQGGPHGRGGRGGHFHLWPEPAAARAR